MVLGQKHLESDFRLVNIVLGIVSTIARLKLIFGWPKLFLAHVIIGLGALNSIFFLIDSVRDSCAEGCLQTQQCLLSLQHLATAKSPLSWCNTREFCNGCPKPFGQCPESPALLPQAPAQFVSAS